MKPASIVLVLTVMGVNFVGQRMAAAIEEPVGHSVFYPFQVSPPPGRYDVSPPAVGPAYNRYANPPGGYPGGVAPPPNVVDRAQEAVSEAGSTLRNTVESGIQKANQQFSRAGNQVLDSTRSVGQGFGEQLQDLGRSTGRQFDYTGTNLLNATEQTLDTAAEGLRQAGDVLGVSGAAPPPGPIQPTPIGSGAPPLPPTSATTTAPLWAPPSTTVPTGSGPVFSTPTAPSGAAPQPGMARSAPGWTGLNENVTAPPLSNPPPATPGVNAVNAANSTPPAGGAAPTGPATGGVAFPDVPTISRDAPPVAPALPSATRSSSGTAGAAARGPGSDPFDQPPVLGSPTGLPGAGPSNPAAPLAGQARSGDAPIAPAGSADDPWPFGPTPPANVPATSPAGRSTPTGQTLLGNEMAGGQVVIAGQPAPAAPNAGANADGTAARPSADPPWMPLLLVSLSLVGSLSANLFLGWSYVDARHKYRALVRKTADKFRRAAKAA